MKSKLRSALSSPTTALSLGLLTLMVTGPFLLPIHTLPITAFWSEWLAVALGLAAATTGLMSLRGRGLILPQVLVVPVVILLALLLQFGFGRLTFPQIGLLYACYLLWAAMLMVLGRNLVEITGFPLLADVLAGAIMLGVLIGAGVAVAQWLGVQFGMGWIFFPTTGGGVYANLGQANHHAHYSWLGIISAYYLRGRGYLPRLALWLLILPMAFGSVLSGSRSVFIYTGVLVAAIAWSRRRDPQGQAASLFPDAMLLLPVVIALNIFATWAGSLIPDGSGTGVAASRLFESMSGSSARLEIARSAWSAFLDRPWLGHGAGNYAWAAYGAASSNAGAGFAVSQNAHNIILQLLTEFGAPATGVAVLALGVWAKRFFAGDQGLVQFWCGTLLSIGAVHALLEYPLWYAYFLGPTAFLLGAADRRPVMVPPSRRLIAYVIGIALLGTSILASLRVDYAIIEAVSTRPLAAHPERERAWRISMDRLLSLYQESLLSPWALQAFAALAEPSRQQVQDRADLCEKAIRFLPARFLVTRCAMQLAIAGRDGKARQLALGVLRAYPSQRETTLNELARGAEEYPEIMPLLESRSGK